VKGARPSNSVMMINVVKGILSSHFIQLTCNHCR
jgi:hypothetical protein